MAFGFCRAEERAFGCNPDVPTVRGTSPRLVQFVRKPYFRDIAAVTRVRTKVTDMSLSQAPEPGDVIGLTIARRYSSRVDVFR